MSFRKINQHKKISLQVNGVTKWVHENQSLAAALLEAGTFVSSAQMRANKKLSPYCLMGGCHCCLVEIDGRANQRSCMTRVRENMTIMTGEES